MQRFLTTRSGKQYSIPISPIWSPPTFQLSKALERALALDNDETILAVDDSAHIQSVDHLKLQSHYSSLNNGVTGVDASVGFGNGLEGLEEGEIPEAPCKGFEGGKDVDMEEGEIFEHGEHQENPD
ncbi:hypothetical protein CVT24_004722 [Panaeolus cyanescens]|uniref:Uncharacterized protein n=1 Tax=Panaeolus cyanescens TaxID=181874 RepID=A0A409YSN1_9AGAR|nr:hypothetical protein CVT24_004722 [Panaeolus cyanescens]